MSESQEPTGVLEAERDRPHPEFTIIVNGREKVVDDRELSFAEVIALAFEAPPTGENVIFTVTYSRALGPKPAGTMVEGDAVRIKDGTVFNVTATDKS